MASAEERYLSLLKKSLLNELYIENEARIVNLALQLFSGRPDSPDKIRNEFLRIRESNLFSIIANGREDGSYFVLQMKDDAGNVLPAKEMLDIVFTAHTMIGRKRLDNLHQCLDIVVRENVPGDVIETGVWKGGATIFMRGYFAIHGIDDRRVWVADSFDGLPKPSHEKDEGWDLSKEERPYLAIGIDEVRDLFDRYDLLDEQVRFLKGWFSDTLPNAPIDQLAILRLDGDLYESTMDALQSLYAKVSPGGFIIVDDYSALPQCKDAVDDFRAANGITEEIVPIDSVSVYWRKTGRENKPKPDSKFSASDMPGSAGEEPYRVSSLLKLLFAKK